MRTTVALLCLIVVAIGCESGSKIDPPAVTLPTGDWTLESIGSDSVSTLLTSGSRLPTLTISPEGSVSGFAGVNRLTAELDMDALLDGSFDLGPAVTTRMAGSPDAMKVESRFLDALNRTSTFRFDGEELKLRDTGATLMTFVRDS